MDKRFKSSEDDFLSTDSFKDKKTVKKKYCRFCTDKSSIIDYKDEKLLKRFITDRGRIISRRLSGNCAKHQRQITSAIKRARFLAILPFVGEHCK